MKYKIVENSIIFENGIKVVNLTPHPITYIIDNDNKIVIPKGQAPYPRLKEYIDIRKPIGIFRIKCKKYSNIENLPAPQENVFYIVSGLIAQAARRKDLLIPNTIRDENGQIIGCDSFSIVK